MTPVLISAVCPTCETRYKVQDSLRGQPMRCPNPQCRRVFTVSAEEAPPPASAAPPAAPNNGQRTGSVGDLVPLVEAQAVNSRPSAARSAPSWQAPPPVRRTTDPAAPALPAPAPAPATPAIQATPRELPPGAWQPPPVRRGQPSAEETQQPPPSEAAPAPAADEPEDHRPPRKRTGLIVGAFVVGAVVLLAAVGVTAWVLMGRSEGVMAAEAEETYKQGKFIQAADMYKQVIDHFPASDKADDYRFMQALCDFRDKARAPDADVNAVLDRLSKFIKDNKKDALKARAADLAESLGWLADAFAAQRRPAGRRPAGRRRPNRTGGGPGRAPSIPPPSPTSCG